MTMEPFWTSEETAKILSVDVQTLKRIGDEGKITRYRIGGQWRYAPSDVRDYLERQKQAATVAA